MNTNSTKAQTTYEEIAFNKNESLYFRKTFVIQMLRKFKLQELVLDDKNPFEIRLAALRRLVWLQTNNESEKFDEFLTTLIYEDDNLELIIEAISYVKSTEKLNEISYLYTVETERSIKIWEVIKYRIDDLSIIKKNLLKPFDEKAIVASINLFKLPSSIISVAQNSKSIKTIETAIKTILNKSEKFKSYSNIYKYEYLRGVVSDLCDAFPDWRVQARAIIAMDNLYKTKNNATAAFENGNSPILLKRYLLNFGEIGDTALFNAACNSFTKKDRRLSASKITEEAHLHSVYARETSFINKCYLRYLMFKIG